MNLINRHESCWGFTLYCFGKYRAELWYCPSSYIIEEHCHPNENVKLMYLFGSCIFYRKDIRPDSSNFNVVEAAKASFTFFGKRFTVNHYHSHWFSVGKLPLIFINFQRFLNGCKPKSASQDFQLTN